MDYRFIIKAGWLVFVLISCTNSQLPQGMPKFLNNRILVATTTNFETGALAVFDPLELHFNLHFSSIHPDSVPKRIHGFSDVFVLNRLGGDNIQRVDRFSGRTLSQRSLGRGTNPQDIEKIAEDVFVTLLNDTKVLIWDLEQGNKKGEVDLTSFADLDGFPEPAQMQFVEGYLWIQIQRLNRLKSFTPNGESQIAVIDPSRRSIVDQISLKGTNPVTPFKIGYDQTLWVANAGFVGAKSQLDGGIERLDPFQRESLGFVISEEELGGDLVDFECASKRACVAIVSSPETKLIQFDPEHGKKIRTLWTSSGYHLLQILRDSKTKLLYLVDSNPEDPSVRVWSEETLDEIKENKWRLELPPYQIEWF